MKTSDYREIINEGEIANAIVAQACADYREAIRGICKDPDEMLQDVLEFFESEWYKLLTKLDYHYLLERLDTEWEEGKKLIKAGMGVDCPKLKKRYEFDCPLCGGRAKTLIKRFRTQKRKDGALTITHYKVFECECHRPEQIMLRQEVIAYGNSQNQPAERT